MLRHAKLFTDSSSHRCRLLKKKGIRSKLLGRTPKRSLMKAQWPQTGKSMIVNEFWCKKELVIITLRHWSFNSENDPIIPLVLSLNWEPKILGHTIVAIPTYAWKWRKSIDFHKLSLYDSMSGKCNLCARTYERLRKNLCRTVQYRPDCKRRNVEPCE